MLPVSHHCEGLFLGYIQAQWLSRHGWAGAVGPAAVGRFPRPVGQPLLSPVATFAGPPGAIEFGSLR